jgi:glutathione S-transferase
MLSISPKGTITVLQLENDEVLDESLDIMFWALNHNDPDHWLNPSWLQNAKLLIQRNDEDFKYYLDHYKYADRYPAYTEFYYRQQAELFLTDLESLLNQHPFLCGNHFSVAAAAILSFIRQFAAVDLTSFNTSPYPEVRRRLKSFLSSTIFGLVMTQHQPWKPNDRLLLFGATQE